jgi:RND family efflux transporter MFP subunit
MHDVSPPQYEAEPVARSTVKRIVLIAVIVFVAIAIWGILSRRHTEHQLTQWTDQQAVPTVEVAHPKASEGSSALVLPGNVQAYNSAAVNARTSGYVRKWYVDIGSRVKAGEVLAVIDAPEVEQQLAQANADLQTARANQALSQTTATRWVALQKQDAVSQQETDEKTGDLAAKKALTNASLANVRRLDALIGFTRIISPFAGTVTSRATQIGQLVTAGTASAQPLFTVSDIGRMRIYIRVPQLYTAEVTPGMHVPVTLPEYPGRTFDTTLTRTAQAVDQASGTELVELQAPNPDGALKPGAYAQAHFPIASATHSVTIPSGALVFRGDGTSVAVVARGGKVTLKPVVIGVDHGKTLDISNGLSAADLVVQSPPDSIQTGDTVKATLAKPQAAPGATQQAKAGPNAKS